MRIILFYYLTYERHIQIWTVLPFDQPSLIEELKTVWAQGLVCFARRTLVKERKIWVSLWYHRVISQQRKVSASQFPLGLRSGAGCTLLAGYPLLTDETLKGKLYFLAKETGRRARRESKFPLELHDCQNNPSEMNELKAKLESSSFRKSNLSQWAVVDWVKELQLFPWWSPSCRPERKWFVMSSHFSLVLHQC